MAESHVAAFYPPNLAFYRILDVSTAYRLSMWLHYVALVATTYGYARCLGISPWGSALAAVSFTLCGFQTIHSSHEPFYSLMPYLPLALMLTRAIPGERSHGLARSSGALPGLAVEPGPFSDSDVDRRAGVFIGLWRALGDGRPWRRAIGLIAATGWGAAVAAVQLGLSWQFARDCRPRLEDLPRAAALRCFRSRTGLSWRCRE